MYVCSFCGHSSTDPEDFELDEQYNKGFWCPYCDGFTYFELENQKHNFVLILENSKNNSEITKLYSKPDFPTQVSPLRYPGGKSKFVGAILENCNSKNMINFVEPFAGGASVGLSLLLAGKIENLYLNDLDYGIYSLFFTIKYLPYILVHRIKTFTPTKKAFYEAKKRVLEGYENMDTTEAAWTLLLSNRMAFSGIIYANCMSNPAARWNPDKLIKKIINIHNVSDKIFISNKDAYEFIEEMYWMSNTTLFIDPPYYIKGKLLYNKYYTIKEHNKLSYLLEDLYKGMPGADMIVTYDYCKEIQDLYYHPILEVINRKYCIAN